MNKEQINNGEVRCFPFYKGKYMGELPFGYSNEKSAKKFMKDIPKEYVYEKFGGEDEYIRTHECLPVLDKSNLFTFNPAKGKSCYSQRTFEGIYDYKYRGECVYLKDLSEELVKEIRKDIKKIKWYYDYENHELVKEFQEKYDLFPNLRVDDDDYDKARKKILKDEVVYRKGIVHVNIEYLD